MSVYIKGMEMPTSCRACHLKMNCDDCEGLECVCVPLHQQIGYWDDLLADKRRDDCPLVPVPEHGRLIDADALHEELCALEYARENEWLDGVREARGVDAARVALLDAPTIIPADKEEQT